MKFKNHSGIQTSDILHESAFIGVLYFNMEKMLLYWSMDQYNNVQKCVERKESAMLPDGRKGLTLHQ